MGAACWARIAREKRFQEAVARLAPPARTCSEGYKAGRAPRDADSIVTFDMVLTWMSAAPVSLQAGGPAGCQLTP